MRPYVRPVKDGLILDLMVTPRAKCTQLSGIYGVLPKVALAAPPVDGKANEELIAFLASLLGVSRKSLEVVKGAGTRRKSVLIRGVEVEALVEALEKRDPSA